MSVKVDLSGIKIDKIKDDTSEKIREITAQATGNLLNLSKRAAPKDTGELQRKHRMKVEVKGGSIEGTVEAWAPHAIYRHEGTGIYARSGNGRKRGWIYEVKSGGSKYKGVHWTRGMKGVPWMEDTIEANRKKIIRMYKGVVGGR